MGSRNREALLRGAAECVAARGYARTTARDIAEASGVSLAAIGYHFGSTETLLEEVIYQGLARWSDHLERLLADSSDGAADPTVLWNRVQQSFNGHRGVLLASYELLLQAQEKPQIRDRLAAALSAGRQGLAKIMAGVDPATEPERGRRLGAFYYTMLSGLLTQWLIDPDHTPTGAELAQALTEITGRVDDAKSSKAYEA